MSKFKVGDTVILTRERMATTEAIVTKVGRKWVYIDTGYSSDRYDGETGRMDCGAYSSRGRIYTPAMWEAQQRRAGLLDRLRAHRITIDRFNQLPADKLEQLLSLLDSWREL